MKKLTAICLLLLASLHARADLTIVENVQAEGQSQDLTIKIKSDKARVDLGNGQISTIIDVNTGDMVTLIHAQKMFMKISADRAKAMGEAMRKAHGDADASPDPPKIVDTGKQEKVGDYNAEVYTGQMQGATFTFWVTKDIPNYAVIKDQLKKMETLQEKLGQGKAPDTSKIDGVPVKTETTKDGKVLTMTLVSVKQDAIADADLQTPADYTEMQVPQMPGGAGAPPPQQPDGAGAPPPPQQPDGSGAPPPPQP